MGDRMTNFMQRISIVFSGVAMIGLAYPAHADTLREKQTEACKGDALRLCALAIPNEKKITQCMERKQDKLSPKCRAFFKKGTKAPPAHKPKSK
ncbi:hypothetical protein BJI49_06825 [Acetobacter pasteurianus]|uniref:Uncharacterized protein n=5 Tax=Acetobacter pasteurianus TaxID=438 RepID=C7JG26_ACEP3|nr:hypothetical protein [Acetobacter pasteurianus]BAU39568.1 hypothetical protein APT_02486 [Acetobacter pasteurianus NBRC 101655]QHM91640.1 hypothetical protein FCN51_08820 [Acetobacter pasteurianus]RCL07334.1 hypothetical protein BJI49_06825 [Acetobacter pasteurianus]CCT59390.1 hypothetical protein APA386B_1301 [Acetobacter pasteurianus 386B]BAI00596.1 hypothetical protein APA01_24900 [Acetobacter pasteurianus IFO 3283-01]